MAVRSDTAPIVRPPTRTVNAHRHAARRRPVGPYAYATPAWCIVLAIASLSFFLHAWRLGHPRQAIFDEVYFVRFVTD